MDYDPLDLQNTLLLKYVNMVKYNISPLAIVNLFNYREWRNIVIKGNNLCLSKHKKLYDTQDDPCYGGADYLKNP